MGIQNQSGCLNKENSWVEDSLDVKIVRILQTPPQCFLGSSKRPTTILPFPHLLHPLQG